MWQEILTGERIATCDGIRLCFRFPSQQERQWCDRIIDGIRDGLKRSGVLSIDEADEMATKRGLWSPALAEQSTNVRNEIIRQEQVVQAVASKEARERLQARIKILRNKLVEIERGRSSLLTNTIEHRTETFRSSLLSHFCVEYASRPGVRFWPSVKDALSDTRIDLVDEIHDVLMDFLSGLPVAVVRAVARNSQVYARWMVCQENGMAFFDEPSSAMNINRLHLCHWLRYYMNVGKNFGDPPEGVLDDDMQFDAWVKGKVAELKTGSDSGGKDDGKNIRTKTLLFNRKRS